MYNQTRWRWYIHWSDSTYIYRKIIGNIVLNGIGAASGTNSTSTLAEGIYLDDQAKGVEVSNNSVANCSDNGIFLHNANNFNIHDNTVYNNLNQLGTQHDAGQHAIIGGSFKNNIFLSKSASQLVGRFISNTTDIPSWGTLDSNYYARPIDDSLTFSISTNSWSTFTNYTLATWQSYSGFDAHSHKSPKTITDVNDLRFEYNATGSTDKTISLPIIIWM